MTIAQNESGGQHKPMPHNHQMSSNASPSNANKGGSTRGPPEGSSSEAQYYPPTYDPQRRHTCWTINNWTVEELAAVREYPKSRKSVRYMCWSQEVGESGTPHLQGYTAWSTTMSLQAFKKALGGRLRFEDSVRGTAQQNRDYCAGLVEKKGNTLNPTFEEVGELPKQGDRADWRTAVEQIRAHTPLVDVIYEQPHLVPCIRALERFETLSRTTVNDRDVRVLYIHGTTGVGKTSAILAAFPTAYWKPEGEWWDKYSDQPVVVLDDFYSDIPYKTALRVLDRYPLWLPHKGGFTPATYTVVVITSNADLDEQYPNITGRKREALYRRIHRVIHADSGISPEIITDALQAPPLHPQVRHQAIVHPHWSPPDHAPHPEGSG